MTDGLKNGSEGANGFSEKVESRGETVENAAVPPASFGQKIKRHFRKFWWLHLIIFCASFLIIALCLVYVGLPNIAQKGVDDTSLKFFELQFLNPTKGTVDITQTAELHSPSIFTPTLDPFTAGLWLVTDGQYGPSPFATIGFPSIHALHGNSNVSFSGQTIPILDVDQLSEYAIQVLSQESVTTALTGKTILHVGALPTVEINYNSSTTYKALNGLKGFNTTDLRIDFAAKAGEPNLIGNAFIPNPSVMTIEMGNVTLQLSTKKKGVVGVATINNLKIQPGDNNLPMTAIVNQLDIIASADLSTGMVELEIIGNSSVYNGEHIVYYERALSSNVLALSMNVTQVVLDSATPKKD